MTAGNTAHLTVAEWVTMTVNDEDLSVMLDSGHGLADNHHLRERLHSYPGTDAAAEPAAPCALHGPVHSSRGEGEVRAEAVISII